MNSKTAHTQKESRIGSSPLMMRWISAMLFMIMLVVGAVQPRSAQAATGTEINTAIAQGVTWLLTQQVTGTPATGSLNGSFDDKGTSYGYYPVAATGFAVAALEHDAEKLGQTALGTYAHKDAVLNGLNYLFANATYDSTNSRVTWGSSTSASYSSGIALMAIARSGMPDAKVNIGPFAGLNLTYKQVAQMVVNWIVAAQQPNGAWGYESAANSPGYVYRDQSVTGWSAMGIGYAVHSMECTVPQLTLTQLDSHNTYIQSVGSFVAAEKGGAGYTDPNSEVNAYKTGHLLYDQYLAGTAKSSTAVQNTLSYFDTNWNETCGYGASGYGWKAASGTKLACYTAMFTSTKGFGAYDITTFGSGNRDWYADFSQEIVNNQILDTTSTGCSVAAPCSHWVGNGYIDGNPLRGTAHALLTLLKATSTPLSSNITPPADGRYGLGRNLDFTVKYSGNVDVTGSPRIKLNIGGTDRYATYFSGTGTTDITFRYTTQASDNDLDGIATVPPIELNGGTMKDQQAPTPLDTPLTFTAPNTTLVLVDTTPPTISSSSATALNMLENGTATLTYTFSEAVSGVSGTNFPSVTASNLPGAAISGSPACSSGSAPCTVWNVLVSSGAVSAGSGSLRVDLANGNNIVDSASPTNAMLAASTFTGATVTVYKTITIPTTLPTGVLTVPYNNSVTASGGNGVFTYVITSGSVPGLSFAANGTFSGTPSAVGNYPITIRATDSNGLTGSQNYTIVVVNTHNVTTSVPSANGTLSCVSPVINGTDSLCTMSPSTGYHLSTLTVAGTSVYTNPGNNTTLASYTITAVGADKAVVANFAINTYSVAANPGTNGTVTGGASGATVTRTTNYGGSETFTFNANSGYHITDISGCGGPAYSPAYTNGTSGVTSYSYTSGTITSDCTISATTAGNQFNVTATPDAHSKVDSYALNTAHVYTSSYSGSNQVTFSTETGYHLTAVTNSCSGTASATYYNANNGPWTTSVTFTASGTIADGAAPNCTITATSAINVYTITPGIATVP